MGLTLDELRVLHDLLAIWSDAAMNKNYDRIIFAVRREIRLKELERTIPKSDVNGNFTTGHGE